MIEPLLSDDALLADIEIVSRSTPRLDLWWLGQSGFLLQNDETRLLVDPYLSDSLTKKYQGTDKPHVRLSRRVVDPGRLRRINVVTASHGHTDHLDAETLQAIRAGDESEEEPWNPIMIAPRAIESLAEQRWGRDIDHGVDDYEVVPLSGLQLYGIASAHEQVERDFHGYCLYLGYVFRMGPFTVYHSGDTVLYDGLVDRLKRFEIDLALLPINGRAPERRVAGNLEGREAAWLSKEIGAKRVVPCHYDMFEFNTATPDEFVAECERLGQPYKVLTLGERLTLSKESVG